MRINPIDPIHRHSKRKRENDSKFLAWVRTQPCVICGEFREWLHGEGRSQAAHVRLNGRGGVSIKPMFSAVPMCHFHHSLTHTKSHTELYPDEWWIKQADDFKERFLHKPY